MLASPADLSLREFLLQFSLFASIRRVMSPT
jgi:hypothetical protein